MKNGHRFRSLRTPQDPHPEERYPPARGGDFGCVLCGAWTTYCMDAEKADEKLGPCVMEDK